MNDLADPEFETEPGHPTLFLFPVLLPELTIGWIVGIQPARVYFRAEPKTVRLPHLGGQAAGICSQPLVGEVFAYTRDIAAEDLKRAAMAAGRDDLGKIDQGELAFPI